MEQPRGLSTCSRTTSSSIGEQIRRLRLEKGLSQRDIEKTSGLLRSYLSRVEHGHTVPTLETLERLAAALDLPLYRLFCISNEASSTPPSVAPRKSLEELAQDRGPAGSEARFLLKLKRYVEKMVESDRALLLDLAEKLAAR
jgi:transcriptional regulator with XRE-family HTH domain